MKSGLYKKLLVFAIIILFIGTNLTLSTELNAKNITQKDNSKQLSTTITLPPPDFTDKNLELSICRRMSVRAFDGSDVTDQELSNILWAAYGYTSNGKRTIYDIDGRYSTIIYVLRKDGTYKYNSEGHSLSLFRNGDYSNIGLYDTASIKIGLVWDTRITDDENLAWAEIGMIGQNIYFEANALNLGTVTTAQEVDQLNLLLLPIYEKPAIIMPLGRPSDDYDFTYDPIPYSNLPIVTNNSFSLEDAINLRNEITIWHDEPLNNLEQSQIIWASYGYSYLIDNLNNKRHRTVPSSHGRYPLHVFAVNHSGVYQYMPSSHSIVEIAQGDRRLEISETVESNGVMIQSAPWIIISFFDADHGNPNYLIAWYYEAGAIAHNIFLECTALDLYANALHNIDDDALRSAIDLSTQTNLIPLIIMPTGKITSSNPPEIPKITGPAGGKAGMSYNYNFISTDPDENEVSYYIEWGDGEITTWTTFQTSGSPGYTASHTWNTKGTYSIKAKARDSNGLESDWATKSISMSKLKPDINGLFLRFLDSIIDKFSLLRRIQNLL
jgi:nitroreductase